jgi:hypothetical protein
MSQLDQQTVALGAATLNFLLPYIRTIANKTAEKIGEALPNNVDQIWKRISSKTAQIPAAQSAVEDLVKNPDDPDLQAAFRVQLRKALDSDSEFRTQVSGLMQSAQS